MRSVVLGLPRPQYVPVPEGFVSALAAHVYEVDYGVDPGGAKLAVAYQTAKAGQRSKTLRYHATRPTGPDLSRFAKTLEDAGLVAEDDQTVLAEAFAAAVAGVSSKEGRGRAAVPMGPALALAQDLRGLMGTAGPPDLGAILERFFAMGAPAEADGTEGAGDLWTRATARRRDIDPLVRSIEQALGAVIYTQGPAPKSGRIAPCENGQGAFANTPFSWFHETWTKLCRDEWVDALPARVWVDWANTVLRLAFGMGYLWEVAWYETVARAVIQGDPVDEEQLRRHVGSLLPWPATSAATSVRDVAASTKRRAMRSGEIREVLRKWVEKFGDPSTCDEQLTGMVVDSQLKADLSGAMTNSGATNQNLWEAINYALLTRAGTGVDTDHYGLLRKQGPRWSVIDPGVEWLAAVATLACPAPGTSTNVGQLLRQLGALGLRPEMGDIVARLERAGIARGSADADQAVEIRGAF